MRANGDDVFITRLLPLDGAANATRSRAIGAFVCNRCNSKNTHLVGSLAPVPPLPDEPLAMAVDQRGTADDDTVLETTSGHVRKASIIKGVGAARPALSR